MVTMKWTIDAQGRPVSAWKTEAPAAQTEVFGARCPETVRLTTGTRHPARRTLRSLVMLATAALK